QKNHAGKTCADQKCKSPAKVGVDHAWVEQHQRAERADRSADPEAPVDNEISPAAHSRGNEFLNRGIDCGIFAADPSTRREVEKRETCDVQGCGRCCGCRQVDSESHKEQSLPTEPICQPAEKNCAQHRSGEIGAARKSDVEVGEM